MAIFRVTHYNSFVPAGESRVVCAYVSELTDYNEVRAEAVLKARTWNRSETRQNMRVEIIAINDKVFAA